MVRGDLVVDGYDGDVMGYHRRHGVMVVLVVWRLVWV